MVTRIQALRPDTGMLQRAVPGIRIPGRLPPLERSVVLSFDDVADGTTINTQYEGVTLATVLPGQAGQTGKGPVYARKCWDSSNPSNVMSALAPTVSPAFDDGTGFIEVTFATPVKSVAVDAIALAAVDLQPVKAKPYLEVLDANGQRLGRVVYPPNAADSTWGTWQRLALDAGNPVIARLRIGSERLSNSSPVYGMFDQLSYTARLLP